MGLCPVGDGVEAVALGDRGAGELRLPDFVCLQSGKVVYRSCNRDRSAVRKARRASARLRIRNPIDSAFPQLVNPVNPSSEP
jgi:hypothetical protein